MLERLLAVLESSDADIAQCGRQIDGFRMTSKMAPPAAVRNRREAIREHINGGINSAVWNKLYRSCIFDEVRFPEGRLFEEAATTYRMILCCNRFATDPFIGYHYVMREGSIAHTHTMDNLADYWVAHKRRHDELIREVPDLSYEERDMLAMDVALAISRTWRWAFGSKPDERARHADALLEMHEFAREALADLDTQHWPSKIRLTLMLARDGSAASLAVGYWLNQVFIKVFPGKSASQQ